MIIINLMPTFLNRLKDRGWKKTDMKEVFLPVGGNIALPNFFADFCAQFGIKINLISLNSYGEFIKYN